METMCSEVFSEHNALSGFPSNNLLWSENALVNLPHHYCSRFSLAIKPVHVANTNALIDVKYPLSPLFQRGEK
jgi:hypothetical protein